MLEENSKKLEELFQLGREAMTDRRWDDALAHFRMALGLAPDSYSAGAMVVMALYERYRDALRLGAPGADCDAEKTAAACRELLSLYPDCPPVLCVLGRVSGDAALQARAYLVSARRCIREMQDTLTQLDSKVQLDPPCPEGASHDVWSVVSDLAHFLRGFCELYTGGFKELPSAYGWP